VVNWGTPEWSVFPAEMVVQVRTQINQFAFIYNFHIHFSCSFRLVQFRYITRKFGLVNGILRHFEQFVRYFVEASFIGVWNWNTQGKPPTCRKSLTKLYHIMLYRVHLANGHKTQNEDKQKLMTAKSKRNIDPSTKLGWIQVLVKEVNVKKDTRHASHIVMFDREVLRKKY
jgi:hypothetical protein